MNCDPSTLVESADCLQCLTVKQQLAAQTFLLMQIAETTETIEELVEASSGFQYVSEKQLLAIQAYLLCQITQ